MGDVMFFGGIILMVVSLVFLIVRYKNVLSNKMVNAINYKKELQLIIAGIIAFGLSMMIFFIGIPLKWLTPMDAGEWVLNVIGSLFSGVSFMTFVSAFILHYYRKDMPKKLDHYIYIIMIASFVLIFAFIWILSEGYARHMTYPLYNGLSFTDGIKFTTALPGGGSPNIAWYALMILSGAVLVYFICDHLMYKEYGKHGLLESTFLVAFPAGIIGARIGYVIGNWNLEFAHRDFYHVFAIWEGGLTIVSGAVVGIIVGVLWFKWRHKDMSVGKVVNIVVPSILIAQGVGRWGNFFNLEVHGEPVSMSLFSWLPSMIVNNMQYSSAAPSLVGTDMIYAPLFIIEALVNFAGYFVLYFGVTRGLKKYVRGGDLAFGYIAWYGMTRVIMEPLRYGSFNMGDDGAWSWIWSIIYVALGIVLVVGNHVLWHFIDKKKNRLPEIDTQKAELHKRNSIIAIGVIGVVSLVLLVVGLVLFFTNTIPEGYSKIALVPHNIGLIMWIVGASLLTTFAIPVISLLEARKILNVKNA